MEPLCLMPRWSDIICSITPCSEGHHYRETNQGDPSLGVTCLISVSAQSQCAVK